MSWIAMKMLMGDKAKYIGIIAGLTFAALLIAQQASIFCGLLYRTTAQVQDVVDADIWVMDPGMEYIDELKAMTDNSVLQVRGVPDVEWAVRLYKGIARLKLEPDPRYPLGTFQQVILLGLDDGVMVGAPRQITLGSLSDLRKPDAVIMDEDGYKYLWPGEPYRIGREFEMNDHRALLVGLCKSSPTFQTFPVVFTRYRQAMNFVPPERRLLSFVLAVPKAGVSPTEAARSIKAQTGLLALTKDQFAWQTIWYYMKRTGIPMNFGITVFLGFVVGCAIAGQTFYTFTIENLPQFGSLKAMGVSNGRLIGMVLLQGMVVGFIGYGLGLGAAALFGESARSSGKLAFYMVWPVPLITAAAIFVIVFLSAMFSIRRVLTLEPAVVFRGG
jgi:putative ABC transport system permease protein